MEAGDRVWLSGGYDRVPAWLCGRPGHHGTIERFIPGYGGGLAAVVRLDTPLTVEGAVGDVVVLELRYDDVPWESGAIVHVELCDFEPEDVPWGERRKGKWVESHASVELAHSPRSE
jgi:hypothetical protein